MNLSITRNELNTKLESTQKVCSAFLSGVEVKPSSQVDVLIKGFVVYSNPCPINDEEYLVASFHKLIYTDGTVAVNLTGSSYWGSFDMVEEAETAICSHNYLEITA